MKLQVLCLRLTQGKKWGNGSQNSSKCRLQSRSTKEAGSNLFLKNCADLWGVNIRRNLALKPNSSLFYSEYGHREATESAKATFQFLR